MFRRTYFLVFLNFECTISHIHISDLCLQLPRRTRHLTSTVSSVTLSARTLTKWSPIVANIRNSTPSWPLASRSSHRHNPAHNPTVFTLVSRRTITAWTVSTQWWDWVRWRHTSTDIWTSRSISDSNDICFSIRRRVLDAAALWPESAMMFDSAYYEHIILKKKSLSAQFRHLFFKDVRNANDEGTLIVNSVLCSRYKETI